MEEQYILENISKSKSKHKDSSESECKTFDDTNNSPKQSENSVFTGEGENKSSEDIKVQQAQLMYLKGSHDQNDNIGTKESGQESKDELQVKVKQKEPVLNKAGEELVERDKAAEALVTSLHNTVEDAYDQKLIKGKNSEPSIETSQTSILCGAQTVKLSNPTSAHTDKDNIHSNRCRTLDGDCVTKGPQSVNDFDDKTNKLDPKNNDPWVDVSMSVKDLTHKDHEKITHMDPDPWVNVSSPIMDQLDDEVEIAQTLDPCVNISKAEPKEDFSEHVQSTPILCDKNGDMEFDRDNITQTPMLVNVEVKQEPVDVGYVQTQLCHRTGPLVVYSDDSDGDNCEADNAHNDSSSTASSLVPPAMEENMKDVEEEISDADLENKAETIRQVNVAKTRSRTEGEIFPEELPPLEYLTLSPDENVQLEPLGVISGIVDILIVIRANDNSPALYDDTILFVDGRKPLGLIFETFGTVEKPYYSVRFNSAKDISEQGFEVGQKVYFAPKADNLTKYVFIAELRKIKCDDASWKDDNEVPASHRDYSDDEEERREKRRAHNKNRGQNGESTEDAALQKKRKKKRPGADVPPEPCQPRLLPGELTRNPFGSKGQRYGAPPASAGWRPQHKHNNSPRVTGPENRPLFRPPPPSPSQNPQRAPRPSPQSVSSFGESPSWPSQPGLPRAFFGSGATAQSPPSPLPPNPSVLPPHARFGHVPPQLPPCPSGHMPFSARVPPPNFAMFNQQSQPTVFPTSLPPPPFSSSHGFNSAPSSSSLPSPRPNVSQQFDSHKPGAPSTQSSTLNNQAAFPNAHLPAPFSAPGQWPPRAPSPFPQPTAASVFGQQQVSFNPNLPPPPPQFNGNSGSQPYPAFNPFQLPPPPLASHQHPGQPNASVSK